MGKWRVLVVDDDQNVRFLVRSTLEPTYEVVEARDGLDALEKVDRAEPDLIVLDIMMPLMDGFQTCESIRKNPKYNNITVLFLSALTGQADIKKGYTKGANLFLTKPFDPARLKRNIDLFFEKKNHLAPPDRIFTLEQLDELEKSGPAAISQATVSVKKAADTGLKPAPQALTPRILVVDDEPGICALATHALNKEFEVFCAEDGIDAISKITSYQPDMILIDTMMPRMSGYQLCQSLRNNGRFARTPIILASAKQSQRDREYSLKIGANYFLQKPYTGIEVLHACREMTKRPDFRVQPKVLTAQDIRALETRHNFDQFQESPEAPFDMHELQDFIRKYAE